MLKPFGAEIFLVSTFPCAPVDEVHELKVIPVAMGNMAGGQVSTGSHTKQTKSLTRKLISAFRPLLVNSRYYFGPVSINYFKKTFLKFVDRVKPDLVHALRIPFEGMLASLTPIGIPFITSIWGNDLTLHAQGSRSMANWTRRTLHRIDGLMADTRRDIQLAKEWGFSNAKPALSVPGTGGVDLESISQKYTLPDEILKLLPENQTTIINPRGLRPGSINVETFFRAVKLVTKNNENVHFVCAGMAGQREALHWLNKLDLHGWVHLLPYLTQEQLWALFERCPISLSVSMHDGTPNTLLEAMALGCLPICGDIASIREWIEDGKNGLLVPPEDSALLAVAIEKGLSDEKLRQNAKKINLAIIKEKANRDKVYQQVITFYKQLI